LVVQTEYPIMICTDFAEHAAETVVEAAFQSFPDIPIRMLRPHRIVQEEDVRKAMEEAARQNALVAYTFIQPEFRTMIREESIRLGVRAVDIMGPMLQAVRDSLHGPSYRLRAGLLRHMDERDTKRMEAIQFTDHFEETKDPSLLLEADIVLLGVSRTSKSPLAMLLGHKGYKAANYPVIPEVKPPLELYRVAKERLFMLTLKPDQLLAVRTQRLKSLGLPVGAAYATMDRIMEELNYAASLADQLGSTEIDMTHMAIEEAATFIIDQIKNA
jgi:hypothetical protein